LALIEIPAFMSTPITRCQHVDKACSTLIFNVTISSPINNLQSHQCHYLLPSIIINYINVTISPPLKSMAKGYSPLGVDPPT
jgi:hypothetical protein